MAKKKSTKGTRTTGKARGRKATPARKKTAPSRAGRKKTATRKTAARKAAPSNKTGKRKKAGGSTKARAAGARKGSARTPARGTSRKTAPAAKSRKTASKTARKAAPARRGGTGREKSLDQTPETGRTVRGRTNPMPTRRSTGTASGAGDTRLAPGLDRARKRLREVEETIPGPPSSLDMDRNASAARSGRRHMQNEIEDHTESSPAITGGDVDADWQEAYAVGDEAPGGDNPTPDQDRVDDIGKALGVTYEDNEELKASDKIAERDRHRWELDPASSDDYKDRE